MAAVALTGADRGPCPLCLKDKEKKLFVIAAPGYPAKVCADHLYVIAEQLKGKKPEGNGQEEPLFDRVQA